MDEPTIKTEPETRTYVAMRLAGRKGKGVSKSVTIQNATPDDVLQILRDGLAKRRRQPATSAA